MADGSSPTTTWLLLACLAIALYVMYDQGYMDSLSCQASKLFGRTAATDPATAASSSTSSSSTDPATAAPASITVDAGAAAAAAPSTTSTSGPGSGSGSASAASAEPQAPAPVYGDTIAEDAQPLGSAYGQAFSQAYQTAAADAANNTPEARAFLPMVAEDYAGAPLSTFYDMARVKDMNAVDGPYAMTSYCSERKSVAGVVDPASLRNRSLGLEISNYDNKVDFLRLLPGQC